MQRETRVGRTSRMPHETALRALPARAAHFLHAVATHDGIRELMGRGGYTAADHAEGLALVTRICAYRDGPALLAADEDSRDAEATLGEWVRTHLSRLEAAVERLHPEALALFTDLPSHEVTATLTVATLLSRVAEWEERCAAGGALATLQRRGFSRAEWERLGRLVTRARAMKTPPFDAWTSSEDREPSADVLALHDWLRDWTMTARTFIARRDWLIRLGLVRRGKG